MKLKTRRRQDLLDVVELINAGANVRRVRQYLEQYGGDLLPVFTSWPRKRRKAREVTRTLSNCRKS